MLQSDQVSIGSIGIYRTEVRPFTDKQIELVESFAAQAVIAIENARLLNELRQSLEQQTATSQVLQVISSSSGDLQPVFASILANATRICEADFGVLVLYENAAFQVAATHNAPPAFVELRQRQPTIHASGALGRVVVAKQLVHISDCLDDASYKRGDADFVRFVDLCRVRSLILAPMLKENELIGVIGIYRIEVRPFADKQIALVQNFANQAVIAIENARLLNELRQRTGDLSQRTADLTEALEQQTATSEVLQVISSSPGDPEPVFAVMLENAVRICDATFGNIHRWDGEFLNLVASQNTPPAFVEARKRLGMRLRVGRKDPVSQMITTKKVVHIADLATERDYIERSNEGMIAAVELGEVRTLVAVPMLKDDELIGTIHLFRREVRPFTDKQIALVTNFAAQAVIAIENTRLLNELRQSLQQQTATADVLKVISRSTFDLQTVLNTLVQSAVELCEADKGGLERQKGSTIENIASYGYSTEVQEFRKVHAAEAGRGTIVGRTILEGKSIQVEDVQADPEYTYKDGARIANVRTCLGVPLLREGSPIGVFFLGRTTVRPFTEKQIDLVTTFADQAVIAIENARLLNELRQRTDDLTERTADLTEALEQQTATSEVLQVISSSQGDLEPVFGAMLENAVRICDAKFGNIYRWEADALHLVASHNTPTAYAEHRRRLPLRFDQMPESLRRMVGTRLPSK